MGELKEDIKSAGNKTAGKIRQVVGEALGDAKMQQRGVDQQIKGEAQHLKGKVEGAVGDDI